MPSYLHELNFPRSTHLYDMAQQFQNSMHEYRGIRGILTMDTMPALSKYAESVAKRCYEEDTVHPQVDEFDLPLRTIIFSVIGTRRTAEDLFCEIALPFGSTEIGDENSMCVLDSLNNGREHDYCGVGVFGTIHEKYVVICMSPNPHVCESDVVPSFELHGIPEFLNFRALPLIQEHGSVIDPNFVEDHFFDLE